LSSEKTIEEKAPVETSSLEEASPTLGEISNGDQDPDPRQETGERTGPPFEGNIEQPSPVDGNGLTVVPWIEPFRDSVDAFYKHHSDLFQEWFRSRQAEMKFEDEFHTLVTILLHARFDQMTPSVKALENTERVYPLMTCPSLSVEEIPALEGTLRFPGEDWKKLFHKAIPRLREVAQHILAGQGWNVTGLEQLLQVIPHMGRQTSRRATQWIRALMAGIVQIDPSQARVLIGEPVYRVAARLGVVDPLSDGWESPNAMGSIKIQSFAKTAFPEDILRIEEPMEWVGNPSEEEGHCVPIHPRCEGCLFDAFCPKLHVHVDPCETGMRKAS
jgi:endonuclease III